MRLFVLLACACLAGCAQYQERFTFADGNGKTHTVDVRHRTFLMFGRAAELKTETQTEEFLRSVNAQDAELSPSADFIRAIAAGIAAGITKP